MFSKKKFIYLLMILLSLTVNANINNDPTLQFNQTSSINITGIASTLDQATIDSYLNVNGDSLTWNIVSEPINILPSWITFTNQQVESLSTTLLENDKIVVAWCDEISKSINFKIYTTYGQLLVDTVTIDSSPGVTDACNYHTVSVSALNSTHFVIAWFDAAEEDATFAVYDIQGNLRIGPIDEDTAVGTNSWGVSVSAFNSTHIVIGYYDYVDQDATFSTWNLATQTRVAGPIDVDTGVSTDSYNVHVAALNANNFAFFYYDAGATDDATFAIYSITGTAIRAATDEDAAVGNSYSLALTVLNSSYFVVAYYDAADADITFSIYNNAGTRVVGPIDEDTNVGTSGAWVSVAALNSTYFVIAYYDTVDGAHYFSIYNWNTRVVGPSEVSKVTSGMKWISVTSYLAAANQGICNQNWIFAEVYSTSNSRFTGYSPSGQQWNGYCSPLYSALVEHNATVSYSGDLTQIDVLINLTSTANTNFSMLIYNFANSLWNSTPCQNVSITANIYSTIWCNVTVNPANYVSSDNKIRVRLNSSISPNNFTLKEEYVQFYINFVDNEAPKYSNVSQNPTNPAYGTSVNISSFWQDNFKLSYAWLATNETGNWENKTNIYNSPINFNEVSSAWANFTWLNLSVKPGTIVAWRIYANDSSGNENVTEIFTFQVKPIYLLVNLTKPFVDKENFFLQNTTFLVNATATCYSEGSGANCGQVNASVRYNLTSLYPDTPVNETFGDKPFFINETPAHSTKICSNNLLQDQSCSVNWIINVSGDVNSSYKIGVLFFTNSIQNHTRNATISIQSCIIDITINFNSIDFGNLFPNTIANPAIGNAQKIYNITINPSSCNTNLFIKATDLINPTYNSVILASNLTFSNFTNNYLNSFRLSTNYQLLYYNASANMNVTSYYWIDVPPIYSGNYFGNITYLAERVS